MELQKFEPTTAEEFVGEHQRKWCRLLESYARNIRNLNEGNMIALIKGDAGVGKTAMCKVAARILVDESHRSYDLVHVSGAEVGLDWTRQLKDELHYAPMGGFRAIIVDEADELPEKSRALFLKVMEDLPERAGLFFTSNQEALEQRFEDRCSSRFTLTKPDPKEIAAWLKEHTELSDARVASLCGKAKGMRSVINQAENLMRFQTCK